MKNRFLALLLAVCLLLPLTALAVDSPTLPDLGKFAGDLLIPGEPEDFGFCKRVTLFGTKEDVKLVAEAYVDRLLKKFDICKHAHFSNFYDGGQSRRHYALGYTGEATVGTVSYEDENEGWQISDAAIVITYSQYHMNNFVQITYCSEFNYKDTGDRLEAVIRQSLPAAPTPRAGNSTDDVIVQPTAVPIVVLCRICNGTGVHDSTCTTCWGAAITSKSCTTCNGKGSKTCSTCDGKKHTLCSTCGGHGSHSCSSCGGTGHHSSSSHHASSQHSSDSSKCSSCGGDGKRSCSTCFGTGTLNCRTCHTRGTQVCGACNGGKIYSRCDSCSGMGHSVTTCGNCNGTGQLN